MLAGEAATCASQARSSRLFVYYCIFSAVIVPPTKLIGHLSQFGEHRVQDVMFQYRFYRL